MSQPPNPDDQIPYAQASQPGQPPGNQPASPYSPHSPYAPVKGGKPAPQNSMGLTGFIISLVSLVICGVTSIIGVIVSAIGLRKEPRGFAIAGLIIGLLGIAECILMIALSISTYRAVGEMGSFFQEIAVQIELQQTAGEIGDKWRETGTLPTQEEGDEIVSSKTDLFENPIIYETDGTSFSVRSSGADQIENTEDDIVVGPFESVEELDAFEIEGLEGFEGFPDIEEAMEKAKEDLEAAKDGAEFSESSDELQKL